MKNKLSARPKKTSGRIELQERREKMRSKRAMRRDELLEIRLGRLRAQTVEQLDEQISHLASAATRRAHRRALAAGNVVIIAETGKLKKVFPDGRKLTLGTVEPSVEMRKGQIIKIK